MWKVFIPFVQELYPNDCDCDDNSEAALLILLIVVEEVFA